jgi:predicted acyltransferase
VLGDGYFEVFKHVWLAAYVLLVTGLCLLGALGAGVAQLAAGRRRREPEPAN